MRAYDVSCRCTRALLFHSANCAASCVARAGSRVRVLQESDSFARASAFALFGIECSGRVRAFAPSARPMPCSSPRRLQRDVPLHEYLRGCRGAGPVARAARRCWRPCTQLYCMRRILSAQRRSLSLRRRRRIKGGGVAEERTGETALLFASFFSREARRHDYFFEEESPLPTLSVAAWHPPRTPRRAKPRARHAVTACVHNLCAASVPERGQGSVLLAPSSCTREMRSV